MDVAKSLGKLVGSRWGLVALFAAAGGTVGVGVLPADDPAVQTAGAAAVVVAGAGAGALVAYVLGRFGGGDGPSGGAPAGEVSA